MNNTDPEPKPKEKKCNYCEGEISGPMVYSSFLLEGRYCSEDCMVKATEETS